MCLSLFCNNIKNTLVFRTLQTMVIKTYEYSLPSLATIRQALHY